MKLPRPNVPLDPVKMLMYNAKFFSEIARKNSVISEAPVRVFQPYEYFPVENPTEQVVTVQLPQAAKFSRVFAVSDKTTLCDPSLYSVSADTLQVTNVFGDLKGILIEGLSYPNPVFRDAAKKLAPLDTYLLDLYKDDPVEFNFRVRDTFYCLTHLPKEWALEGLVNVILGMPYARVSGVVEKQYLYTTGKLEILYNIGDTIYYDTLWVPAYLRDYWTVQTGDEVHRCQPLTNFVLVEVEHHTVSIKLGKTQATLGG